MTIRYETPRIDDLGSLVELTGGKPQFGPHVPAMKGRGKDSSSSSSHDHGLSGKPRKY